MSEMVREADGIGQQYWKALAELHAEELDEVRKALVELEQEIAQERAWVVKVVSNIGLGMTAAELADAVLAVMNRRRKGA